MGERPVDVSLGALVKFFPARQIEEILRANKREEKRRRKLPSLELMYLLIALGLYASEGCRAVLRRVLVRRGSAAEDLDRISSDSAISQGRSRLGWKPIRDLYQSVVRPIATRKTIGAMYRRWRLVTLDGSTLDLADTSRNERAFGRPGSSRGKAAFPQLRWVSLLENGTHVLFGAEMGHYRTGEKTLAKKVIPKLPADALCMADRNFFSYVLWNVALATGAALLWRVSKNLVLPKLRRLPDGSYLSKIYPSSKARAADRDGILVRLIEYRLEPGGTEVYRLLCSILDWKKAPGVQLADLYSKRWTIETVLGEIKTRLRGARVVLRSKRPDLVRQDFYGLLLAHFGVRALMLEAALQENINPSDLSFLHAVRTIDSYLPLYLSFFPAKQKALAITLV
jgi:Insertion element 4 transposase N-terminal/Transposase DDE domain